MIDHNNKNFILAIVLSMAIIFGWQYFYAIPIAEQARQETTTAQPNTTTTTTTTAQVPGSPTAVTPVTRDQALASSPRLKIDTPELQALLADMQDTMQALDGAGLAAAAANISTREELIAFIASLRSDMERHPDAWKVASISAYLSAVSANASRLQAPDEPVWRTMAKLLLAARG